jgi:protein SCO1/2
VCPLHVANVAAVLKRMPFEEREQVRFVFVTTDAKRDTPARLKEWLGNFDPSFVGLTAKPEEVNRLLAELQMPPIENDPKPTDSVTYLVGHAAQVLAFSKDGQGRLEYPFGVRQEDWRNDLSLLARGIEPEETGAAQRRTGAGNIALQAISESAAARATAGRAIHVLAALMPQPATTSEGALYLVLQNDAPTDDTLTGVWSELARSAQVHETMKANGQAMSHMSAVPAVAIGARSTVRFVPGGRHVMLMQLTKRPVAGESVPVRLRFAHAGELALAAEVVPYAELEKRLAAAR